MTPEDLKKIRRALGMTQSELGRALKLAPKNAGRILRRWEAGGAAVSGPAQVALTYMMQGVLDDEARQIIPEYVVATDAAGEADHELIIRLWRPRCILVTSPKPIGETVPVDGGIEYLSVAMWIDDPAGFDQGGILARAAAVFSGYTAGRDYCAAWPRVTLSPGADCLPIDSHIKWPPV